HNQLAELFTDVIRIDERPQWLSSEDRPVSDRPPVEVPVKAQAPDTAGETKPAKKTKARTPRSAPGIATA
ncbi:MAG TPA: cell division protein FtsH, partial [Terrimesophilobacter sp.]|nr:cell division protein FtsH [Terrimesophilobacter sp.]